MKQVLHFAHGNGFPSPCYRQMLAPLGKHFACCYIDKIGHTDSLLIEDNWTTLVDELIESVRSQSTTPVIAVGHSLGGVLSLLAAFEAPELFQKIILLDSPLLSPVRAFAVRLSKKMGFIDRITPAYRTRVRRAHWQSRAAALKYLESRALFQKFDPACLNDYIDYGMNEMDGGYTLRFDPAIEYQIYRTLPHSFSSGRKKLSVPTTLIYGADTDIVHPLDRRYMQKKHGIKVLKTQGTHLFPFEHPKTTAALILKLLGE